MSLCLSFAGSAGLDATTLVSITVSPSPMVLYL
jgi:hypothetical protein